MLDIECFTYLNRALESSISPIVILASNRGRCTIRGTTDIISAHGIPPDLLARILIIPTHPYTSEEIKLIVRTRVRTEALAITDPALDRVANLGTKISLRYALQLLAPANILAKVRTSGGSSGEIDVDDVAECEGLFLDARRSATIVSENGEGFIS